MEQNHYLLQKSKKTILEPFENDFFKLPFVAHVIGHNSRPQINDVLCFAIQEF
jgi:hypothetical protein